METLAYLHAAVAYETPDSSDLDFELGSPVWLQSLSWHTVSAHTATSLLAIACSLSIVGGAGNALALQRNDSGSSVVTLQTDLHRAGYYNGTVTGFYGEVTETAILRLQQENGLTADGVAGPKTLEVLQAKASQTRPQNAGSATAEVSLQRGDQGTAVVELQTQLKSIGYFDGPITGFYGRLTEAAVVRFQQDKRLTADGKAGARTLALLRQETPAQPPSPKSTAAAPAPSEPANPVASASMAEVLSRGDRGETVAELQNRLRNQGYFDGPMTGFYGRLTEEAVTEFQQVRGLNADGKAGSQTLAALDRPVAAQPAAAFAQGGPASPVSEILQRGDRGAEVTALQNRLKTLGYFDGPVTGFFGRLTEEAMFRFQREKGLGVDGKVGPNTVTALEKAVPPAASSASSQGETAAATMTDTVFQRGDRGLQVADLQNRLRNAGYFDGPMTGFYGRLTEDAVTKFQQEKGLAVDGKVGPKTLTALRQLSRPQASRPQAGDRTTQTPAPQPTTASNQTPTARPSPQASASTSAPSPTAQTSMAPSPQVSAASPAPITTPRASVAPSPQSSVSSPSPQAQSLNVPPPSSPSPTAAVQPSTAEPQASSTHMANQPLKLGDSGVEVAELQSALKRAGYLQGQVTGFFGKLTEKAVMKFQQAKGLTPDGIAGTRTQEALRRAVDP